jgi:hypothetical protein
MRGNDVNEEVQILVEWYRKVPEDLKRYVTFRHERMKDESVAELYEILRIAEKLSKEMKRASKSH